jgi:hypothetical protein
MDMHPEERTLVAAHAERLITRSNDTSNDDGKAWFSSLAAKSGQAEVSRDPADAQDPRYPDRVEPQ